MFKFSPENTIEPIEFYNSLGLINDDALEVFTPRGVNKTDDIDANQFMVFQINNLAEGKTILEAAEVEPIIEGSPTEPDIYANIEMQSFHLAQSEKVDRNTKAMMRLVVGKDKSSRDRMFDDLFWTISAGLELYNEHTGKPSKPNQFKSDFSKALGNRPIEIPGGLANITFEVVKHQNPKWWKKVFGFLKSETGQSLTSVIGFPGITNSAINVLDGLFDRLGDNNTIPLFKSRPMILAMSRQAKTDYTGGVPRIKIGSINTGFCVFARRRDYHTIANANAYFYPHYGILVPSNVDPGDVAANDYDDPLKDITYTVFKINLFPAKLPMRYDYQSPLI